MQDLVIPVFGGETIIPEQSIIKDLYESILKEENINFNDFKQLQKQFNVSGSVRPLIVLPGDLEQTLTHFDDPEADLVDPEISHPLKA